MTLRSRLRGRSYEMDSSGNGAVIKCRLSKGMTEHVLDLKSIVTTSYYGSALALVLADSPLLLRDAGSRMSALSAERAG